MEHGATGYVVPGDDARGLASAMETLVRDEPGRLRMGRAARAAMESRSFDRAFMETWELYRCAC